MLKIAGFVAIALGMTAMANAHDGPPPWQNTPPQWNWNQPSNAPGGNQWTWNGNQPPNPPAGDQWKWRWKPPTPTAAPEIDPAGALSGLTLLLGGLAVVRGWRRKAKRAA
jgi:hypothetical protein